MNIYRISAFSNGRAGGNPAGVVIENKLPSAEKMQCVAADVGFSETAFATPAKQGWRVRYFSPESEVPFCGHATIALGAALAKENGDGVFDLVLNEANITVEGVRSGELISAALQSPATFSKPITQKTETSILNLFSIDEADLKPEISVALANAGANHIVVMLNSRKLLRDMQYDLDAGRLLMNELGVVTVLLGHAESPRLFHTRNPFASGGVYEDPATGAATAALAGYLRDLDWPHEGAIDIVQGEDMGLRSHLHADIPNATGASIRVSGTARFM